MYSIYTYIAYIQAQYYLCKAVKPIKLISDSKFRSAIEFTEENKQKLKSKKASNSIRRNERSRKIYKAN